MRELARVCDVGRGESDGDWAPKSKLVVGVLSYVSFL